MKICNQGRCEAKVFARGLCNKHWYQWRKTAKPEEVTKFFKKPCSVEGCNQLAHARSYCVTHHNNWRRRGDPTKEAPVKWHGLGDTPEYKTWVGMKTRCYNANEPTYKYYGGAGIKVCDRWLEKPNGFLNFLADMGKRPDDRESIDRIDSTKDYSPENCRWATRSEQNRNKRTPYHNTSGVKGVYKCKPTSPRWYAKIGRGDGTVDHLGGFDTFEEAVAARKQAELKYSYY